MILVPSTAVFLHFMAVPWLGERILQHFSSWLQSAANACSARQCCRQYLQEERKRVTQVGRAISLKVSGPNCARSRANFKAGPGREDKQ